MRTLLRLLYKIIYLTYIIHYTPYYNIDYLTCRIIETFETDKRSCSDFLSQLKLISSAEINYSYFNNSTFLNVCHIILFIRIVGLDERAVRSQCITIISVTGCNQLRIYATE